MIYEIFMTRLKCLPRMTSKNLFKLDYRFISDIFNENSFKNINTYNKDIEKKS